MKLRMMPVAAAMALMTFVACDKDDDDNNDVNSNDRTFVTSAALSNTAEIQAAELAKTKSTDLDILNYAQMMIDDHTKAQDSLQLIAGQLGLYAPDSVDAAHVASKAMLEAMSGRAFDSAYIHGQVTDHEATVTLMNNEKTNGNNSSVKTYVDTYLPGIEMHLDHAGMIAGKYPQ